MTAEPAEVLVALGANLGRPLEALRGAVEALDTVVSGLKVGGVYRSAPEDGSSQPDFLNTAVAGRSGLGPAALLAFGRSLEARAGREEGPPGRARPLDVDLIFHGTAVCRGPELVLPHPRWHRRAFVLLPALDVAPDRVDPATGRTVAERAREAGIAPDALPRVVEPGGLLRREEP